MNIEDKIEMYLSNNKHLDEDSTTQSTKDGKYYGEQKEAVWHKKFKQLTFWKDRQTKTTVNAETLKQVKSIIKKSGVEQSLTVVTR